MKVRAKKSFKYAFGGTQVVDYNEGEVYTVADADAAEMIKLGQAEELSGDFQGEARAGDPERRLEAPSAGGTFRREDKMDMEVSQEPSREQNGEGKLTVLGMDGERREFDKGAGEVPEDANVSDEEQHHSEAPLDEKMRAGGTSNKARRRAPENK
jgi:hypothetical protein